MDTNSSIPAQKKAKPETVFKYEPFSAQSLQNLKAQSIYFGSPLGFNDPYDCAIRSGIIEPTDEELEKYRVQFLPTMDSVALQNYFTAKSSNELREDLSELLLHSMHKISDKVLKNIGVTCLSESNSDLLMWAHYGGKYKGFCLEFYTEFELFKNIRNVEYVEDIPKYNAAAMILNDDTNQILNMLCIKSKSWAYEKEWRAFGKAGSLCKYDSSTLKSIYFGPEIDANSRDIVCLILAGQNSSVTFWQGKRSEDKFEVLFEKYNHISDLNIQNKRFGIINHYSKK